MLKLEKKDQMIFMINMTLDLKNYKIIKNKEELSSNYNNYWSSKNWMKKWAEPLNYLK